MSRHRRYRDDDEMSYVVLRWMLVAPVVATAIATPILAIAFWALQGMTLGGGVIPLSLGLGVIAAVFAVLANCTIGAIWHLIARHRNFVMWYAHAAVGALSAAILSALILALSFDDPLSPDVLQLELMIVAWSTLVGGLTGFFGWLARTTSAAPSANPPTSAP